MLGEKPLGIRMRTNNKLNSHLTRSPGIETRRHWWERSAFTITTSLLQKLIFTVFFIRTRYGEGTGFLQVLHSTRIRRFCFQADKGEPYCQAKSGETSIELDRTEPDRAKRLWSFWGDILCDTSDEARDTLYNLL